MFYMKPYLNEYALAHITTEEFERRKKVLNSLTKEEYDELVEMREAVQVGRNLTSPTEVKGWSECSIIVITSNVYHPDYVHTYNDYVRTATYEDFKEVLAELNDENYEKPTVNYPPNWTRKW